MAGDSVSRDGSSRAEQTNSTDNIVADRVICYRGIWTIKDDSIAVIAYGAVGYRVEKKEKVVPILKSALRIKNKPVVIDFIVPEEENVFPMVPAGAALDEVITHLV